jgi:hypothetical protein
MNNITWEQACQAIKDLYDKQDERQRAYDEAMGNSMFLIESRYYKEMLAANDLVREFKEIK